MPARGAKPKPAGQAITRHKPLDWTEVPNVPFEGRPLPPTRRNGDPWPVGIKGKWAAWSTMPHAAIWSEGDWQFALDSIEVAATFMDKYGPSLAAELRNREKVMGTTMDYRRDIRVRYVDAPATTLATVTSIDYSQL